jgi:tetratricopeptide (TPR) repeat protein
MATCNFDASRTKSFVEAFSHLGARFRARRMTVIVAAAVVAVALAGDCQAAKTGNKPAPLPIVLGQGQAATEPLGGEKQVLALLAAGRQSEAEALLAAQVQHFPKAIQLVGLLQDQKPEEADKFAEANFKEIRAGQRTLFLLAACARSRFDIKGTGPFLHAIYGINTNTPSGKCAQLVRRLDSDKMRWAPPQIVNDAFADFKKLVDANPGDIMIRWMMAVECRHWDRNAEGAQLYQQILEQWEPGPSLVHQTYANLLDELHRYDDALVERYKTVKLEPAAWSYDGLGNTLDSLGRSKEASEAHAMAARLAPNSLPIWIHWARGLLGTGKYHETLETGKHAAELERQPVVLPPQ